MPDMSASALAQRVLAVAVPALLIAGGVTAFAQERGSGATVAAPVSGKTTPTEPSAGAGPTSTTAGPASTTTSSTPQPAPGSTAPGSTAPPAAPSTTVGAPPPNPSPLPTVPGVTADPGQPTATATGTYYYAVTMSGTSGSTTMTQKVVTESSSGGFTLQQVTQSEPQQGSGAPGEGNDVEHVSFGPQGNSQLATDLEAAGQTIDCTWSPPIRELPAGLASGKHWTLAGSCHVTVFGQAATIQLSGQGTVVGSQVVTVGSDDVAVWVIDDSYTIVVHVPAFGVSITLQHSATDRVSGRLGLIIEEDATDSYTSGTQTMTTVSHQTLQSIHPT